MPNEYTIMLDAFADIMPLDLLKGLPFRHVVNHSIKLEPGLKPSILVPYLMSACKLVELWRQLEELHDVGYIRPSKVLMAH